VKRLEFLIVSVLKLPGTLQDTGLIISMFVVH
jgi:hypothetical protein